MLKRFVNPTLSGPWYLIFLICLIWQLSAPAHAQAQPQNPLDRKNVLVLYSEDKAHPTHELTDQGDPLGLPFKYSVQRPALQ